MPPIPLRVGMFGGGTVGGGVVELCSRFRERFLSLGADITIAKICVRSLDKPRDFAVPNGCQLVTDFSSILEDPEINCVVEVMGGTGAAKDVVMSALAQGKHVVTANKALLATFLPEIQAMLSQRPGTSLAYEAAVCGGIPVITSLQNDFLGDSIETVMGIMNGTTNFMLCKMEGEGADYGAVLKEAQDLGFAEADPTADVEGHDVQAKLALLTKIAFGKTVPVESIPTTGISGITSADFEYAKMLNATIKLLGTARTVGNKLAVYVSPVVVPLTHPLASARGPGNMVSVGSNNNGATTYAGPGAGRFPTANSVTSDLVRVARGLQGPAFPLESAVELDSDYEARFYVRISISDQLGVIRSVGEVAERHGVSIFSILQNTITDPSNVDFVVTTDTTKLSQVTAFVDDLAAASFTLKRPHFMSLL